MNDRDRPTKLNTLVGRADELAQINQLLIEVECHGSALLVRGEAGIGKSTLLSASEEQARARGFRVLRTAGVEIEAGLPFSGLHRLIRPLLSDFGELADHHRSALLSAFGMSEEITVDQVMVSVATLELLSAQAASGPLLIVADDLHWLDQPSRDAITFVARRVHYDAMVVLGGVRDGYDNELGELRIKELRLPALTADDASRLLDQHAEGVSAPVRERLLAMAAGNPLALVELPAFGTSEATTTIAEPGLVPVSARLERAFARRLQDLSPDTAALLLVAAADEASSADQVLAAAEVLSSRSIRAEAFEPAVDVGLLLPMADRAAFRHPLARSAVYQAADLNRRKAAHLALSKVLAEGDDRRAWHLAAASTDRDDTVAEAVATSAGRAQQRGAILQAALLLGRSAELTRDVVIRAERLLRAADLAFQAGRKDIVQRFVDEARSLALSPRDEARAELLAEIFHDGIAGGVERVNALVETATQVGEDGDVDLAVDLLKGAALRCWWSALDLPVRRTVLKALEALPLARTDPRRIVVMAIATPIVRGAEVVAILPDALDAVGNDAAAMHLLAIAAHAVGDHDTAKRVLIPLVDVFRREGRAGLLTQAQSMLQWDAVMLGDWALAAEAAAEGDRLARETAQPVWGAGLTCGLSVVAAIRGDEEHAEELAADAESVIMPHKLGDMHSVLLTARGIAALSAGRDEHAWVLLRRVFDSNDPSYHWREQFGAVSFLADAAVMCDRETEAAKLIDHLEILAADVTAPALRFSMEYARTVLASDEDAYSRYRELIAIAGTDRPFDTARLHLSYGTRLLRQGQSNEARRLLELASIGFDDVGARAWGDRARRELSAAGSTETAKAPNRSENLTDLELQIAQLAAAGMTDSQIAVRVLLSQRTVTAQRLQAEIKLRVESVDGLARALASIS